MIAPNVETLCHKGQFRRNILEERGFDFTVMNKDLLFQILFHPSATLLPRAVGQDSPNEGLQRKGREKVEACLPRLSDLSQGAQREKAVFLLCSFLKCHVSVCGVMFSVPH